MSWDQYSETPASNYITGYFLTGMAPSNVKVAGSDIMADLASRFAAMHTATGTANAQVVTQTRQWASLVNGLELIFIPQGANTGATTLAVDGLTAKNIFFNGAALTGGELSASVPAWVKYDGTQFNLAFCGNGLNAAFIQNNKFTYFAAAGTNTITATPSPALSAYADGQRVLLKIANTTTNNATTLNLNGLGAKNIYYSDGVTQLIAGSLLINNIYTFTYNSSLNSAAGGFICSDPSRATGSFTLTLTSMSAGGTGTINWGVSVDGKSASVWAASAVTGTSNAAPMTGTGVPNSLVSSINNLGFTTMLLEDNGTFALGALTSGLNTNTWVFGKATTGSSGGFTTSGTKGISSGTYWNYPLG